MALKRCTSTEMRWYKKLASLDSPVLREIFMPTSFNRLLAEELETTRVSTAIEKITALRISPPYEPRPPMLLYLPHEQLH